MADTLGKILARVPAATTSTSNLFASARAMTAGFGHLAITSDLNHLMNISATGPVFTHQGKIGFYRGPIDGTMSTPPTPSQVVWTPSGPDPGSLNYRVTFRVDPYAPSVLPVLRLRCWLTAPPSGTETSGVVLSVGPSPVGGRFTSDTTTSTTGEDMDLTLAIEATDLFPVNNPVTLGYSSTGAPEIGEPHVESSLTAWIGFINTSNKNSDVADALGIVLSLEYPT